MSDVPSDKTCKLGSDIEIYCRFCRLNLDAVVASFAPDGRVAKVQCRTCMHFQNYKEPKDMEEKHRRMVAKAMRIAEKHNQGPARAETKKSKISREQELSPDAVMRRLWEEATGDVNPLKAKVYDKHRSYSKDDIVLHKANGMGVVMNDDVEYSMTVLFRDKTAELERDIPREDW